MSEPRRNDQTTRFGMGLFRLLLSLAVIDQHFMISAPLTSKLKASVGAERVGDLGIGHAAVLCFFVTSGFVIAWVLDRKYPLTAPGLRAFWTGRFVRIYPLYWLILLSFVGGMLLFGSSALPDPSRFMNDFLLLPFGSLGMVRPLNEFAYSMINMPAWTLPYDLLFYLVAPWLFRSRRLLWGVTTVELFYVISLAVLAPTDMNHWHPYYFTSGHSLLLAFCVGGLAYRFRDLSLPRPLFWISTLVLAYLAIFPVGLPNRYVNALLILGLCPFVLIAFKGRSQADDLMSELTYSVYLLHIPIMTGIAALSIPGARPLTILVTYIVAYGLMKGFEEPLNNWRARYAGRLTNDSHATEIHPWVRRSIAGMFFLFVGTTAAYNLVHVPEMNRRPEYVNQPTTELDPRAPR